ncbi:MAG: amidohydrolase family protein [Devosia sp.]
MKRLFRPGQLIDGMSAKSRGGMAVLVEGDRIVAVAPAGEFGSAEGSEIIDAPDKTLMPGLIDAHVHLAYSGSLDRKAFRAEHVDMNYAEIALRALRYAEDTLRAGFTSLRDMHAPGGTIIDLRRAISAGHVRGPRIKACGAALSIRGGHMDQPGWGDHVAFTGMTAPCDGPDGFRRGVREQIKRGADFIKINSSTSSTRTPGVYGRLEMSPDEIRAVCDEAHQCEVKVASHTVGGTPVAETIRNGVDCVEHAHFTDEETIALMVENGTYFVPTLLVNERNFDFTREELGVPVPNWAWLQASREAKWETLARARAAGVRICSGSDAGFMITHGADNWGEIALLVKGGLTEMDAIIAATATNADLLEIEAGRIAPGKLADILLVDGDPLADIAILRQQAALTVYLGGEKVD